MPDPGAFGACENTLNVTTKNNKDNKRFFIFIFKLIKQLQNKYKKPIYGHTYAILHKKYSQQYVEDYLLLEYFLIACSIEF